MMHRQQQHQWQRCRQRRSTAALAACHGTPPTPQHRRARSQHSSRCRAHHWYQAAADPVVSTAWLQEHLDEVAVLDVRGRVDTAEVAPGVEQSTYLAGYASYLEGHVPGAVYWDWTRDAIDLASPVPVQLQCDADLLAAALEAKGIGSDRPVVAYDEGDGMLAARLWWLLTVAGHPNALVLEGGWAKWRAEGRPSELHEPCTLKVYASFEGAMQLQLRATLEDVRQALQQQQQQDGGAPLLLDTRNARQFAGQVRRGPRGGRIPGAISLPRAELLDAGGTAFKPLDEQAQLLRQAGVKLPDAGGTEQQQQQQRQVICYCNGGVAAASAALALHRLGHRNWSIYDGSWNEYAAASDLPVELPAGE